MPGQYYLRAVPGGRGAAVGRVWRVDKGPTSGTFYSGEFAYDLRDGGRTEFLRIDFHDRHTPKTAMDRLEAAIRVVIPDATFSKEF